LAIESNNDEDLTEAVRRADHYFVRGKKNQGEIAQTVFLNFLVHHLKILVARGALTGLACGPLSCRSHRFDIGKP